MLLAFAIRVDCWLRVNSLSLSSPKGASLQSYFPTAWSLTHAGAWGNTCPGTEQQGSSCWTSRGYSQPTSPASWGPSEWKHNRLVHYSLPLPSDSSAALLRDSVPSPTSLRKIINSIVLSAQVLWLSADFLRVITALWAQQFGQLLVHLTAHLPRPYFSLWERYSSPTRIKATSLLSPYSPNEIILPQKASRLVGSN